MRPQVALLLLTLALLAPSPAQAQDAEAPVLLLEDDGDDLQAYARVGADATPVAPPGESFQDAELLGLAVQELPMAFALHLRLATLEGGPEQGILAAVHYTVAFRHADNDYLLRIFHFGATYEGYLELMTGSPDPDFGAHVADVPVTADPATTTLVALVPRDAIVDSNGAAPFPGRVLDRFEVRAGYLHQGGFSMDGVPTPWAYVQDRMPDDGPSDIALPVRFGIAQSGDLRLGSEEPFRASNGEASTFVFRINATNVGDRDHVAEFVAQGVPAGWDVRLPGLLRLAPGEETEVPVIVRTAFSHKHGTATAITIELASQQDPGSVGRVQLGLRYPKIAQPAGHHPTLYLHDLDESSEASRKAIGLVNWALAGYDYLTYPYMNTAPPEEDTADARTPVPGEACESLRLQEDGDTVGSTYCWWIPLQPGLEMGLDFDLGATGTYTIPISSVTPQPGLRVQGRILHMSADEAAYRSPFFLDEERVLATLLPSDRVDLSANGKDTFTGVIQPEPDGDLVAYERGNTIVLLLEARTGRPDNFFLGPKTEPTLQPGGSLTLPLLEYEDPVDEGFGLASVLHAGVEGEARRLANPGDTVVYTVRVHNAAADAHDLRAAIVGSNREWARLLGDDAFRVEADGSRVLTVAVTVPPEASDEDRADLVLEVASRDDVAARAIVRLVTTADVDAEHADDGALLADASKGKDAPAAPAALLAVAVLALAAALRRRPLP